MDLIMPNTLKSADIARFAHRAAQLENLDLVMAYWCNYWIVNHILSKGLHKLNDENMTYTMHLMDKLEQTKSSQSENEAVIDDLASQAYVEQFGLKTLQRAENAMKLSKVSRQTADTFLASATFLELSGIWGPLEPGLASKIKYAKYHALRITRALKAGEDPNLSNPVEQSLPPHHEQQPLNFRNPNTLDDANATAPSQSFPLHASVEAVPNEDDSLKPHQDQQPSTDQNLRPQNSLATETKNEASLSHDPANYYNHANDPEISFSGALADADGFSRRSSHFQGIPGSANEDHIPPLPTAPPNDLDSYKAKAESLSRLNADENNVAQVHEPVQDFQRPSILQSFPPPSTHQQTMADTLASPPTSYFSQPLKMPASSSTKVQNSNHPAYFNEQDPSSVSIPSAPPSQKLNQAEFLTDEEAILKAQKHAKWAISALNFEDVNTAVKELRGALASLGAR